MGKKPPTRGDHLRAAIAQESARLMAEHGIRDFGVAKRKAAERFGVTDGPLLPRNTEIEAALQSYQRLFGRGSHGQNLERLRRAAIKAMKLLAAFEPRLVGPVLSGTATEHTDVQLHLFSDSPEAVYISLMDRQLPHEVIDRRVKMQADRQITVPGLRFALGDATVEALVFPRDGIRQAPISPVDGKPMRRASAAEIDALLDRAGDVNYAS
jgi:hypothetical protein